MTHKDILPANAGVKPFCGGYNRECVIKNQAQINDMYIGRHSGWQIIGQKWLQVMTKGHEA